MKDKATEVALILKVMAHPERLLLLCQLSQEKLSVSQLESRLEMGQSQISQSLQKLEAMGIVTYQREGKQKFFELSDPKTNALIQHLYAIFCKEEICP